jgi:hypothetical protein
VQQSLQAAQIGDRNPGLVFFQNADDLIFGEPAALHLWSSQLGQRLPQTGLGEGGNVSRDPIRRVHFTYRPSKGPSVT